MNVGRAAVPWRWTDVLLAPVELLAVVWSIPLVILAIGVPIALAITLARWLILLGLAQL